MKKAFGFVLFLIFVLVSNTKANLISTFDNDTEDWRLANDVTLSWQNTGGNPGGFLQGNDWADGRTWHFVTPVSWEGDWSQYINGTLSFDLKLIDPGGGSLFFLDLYDVIIYGHNGDTLYYSDDKNYPASTWTHYELQLKAATFGVSEGLFVGVMNNVKEVWIKGEFTRGSDIEGLDNVYIMKFSNPPCEGDFDSDGDVDGSDLAVFAADFGRIDCPVSQTQSLKSENSLLKREIERLKAENAILKKENEKLTP